MVQDSGTEPGNLKQTILRQVRDDNLRLASAGLASGLTPQRPPRRSRHDAPRPATRLARHTGERRWLLSVGLGLALFLSAGEFDISAVPHPEIIPGDPVPPDRAAPPDGAGDRMGDRPGDSAGQPDTVAPPAAVRALTATDVEAVLQHEERRWLSAAQQPVNLPEYMSFLLRPSRPYAEIFGLGVKTIVIDAGHGGKDPGSTGALGTQEKDITLDIARRLGQRLQQRGDYRVLLTRDGDTTLRPKERVSFANTVGADLFISIHLNSLPNTRVNALETYYFGPHEDDQALRLAEQENRDSQYSLSEFRSMVQQVGNAMKLQESRGLALAIQKSLADNVRRQRKKGVFDVGVKTAPFVVLLGVEAPSVLTEVSCISSSAEERRLQTEQYREEIASYIEDGIVHYLRRTQPEGTVAHETKTERVAEN